MRRRSIVNQVMLPLVIATVCLGGILLVALPQQIEKRVRDRTEIELESGAESLSLAIKMAIVEEDMASLEQISQQLSAHPYIAMAEVKLDTPQGPVFLAEFPYDVGYQERLAQQPERYRKVEKPFTAAELSGLISIAMDEYELEQSVERYKVPVYLAFVVFSLVQLLVFSLLRTRVLQPISQAAEWSNQLSLDDMSASGLEEIRDDEIGDLQRALLELSERLGVEAGNNRSLMESLESAVDARTRELETARLELDRVQRSKMIERLAGGVAHDFNNLLTAIDGNLRFALRETEEGSSLREAIEDAVEAVRSGAELNMRLLSFAESSNVNAETVPLREFLNQFNATISEFVNTPINYYASDDVPGFEIQVSPFELSAVLQALLQNAAEAGTGSDEDIWLQVSMLSPASEQAARVEFVVSDQGVGMTPEIRAHCFDPFFSTKSVGTGRGLGLSRVLNFAESSGGGCEISSEQGSGTTVRLWIPAKRSAEYAFDKSHLTLTSSQEKPCLLLVDDDSRSRRSLLRSLQPLGLEIIECKGGAEALARLVTFKDRLRCVISDVVMPNGVDGFRLKRELQKIVPGVPVVLVSGFDFPVSGGQEEVLPKPLDPSVVQRLLVS